MPPDFQLLLKTPRYPVHSMIKLHPSSTAENPLAHIFTVQGHPEFTPSIVSKMVDVRSEQGIFDSETAKEARRRLGGKNGTGGEGFGRVGWAIWRVILQDLPLQTEVHAMEDVQVMPLNHVNGFASSSKSLETYLADEGRYAHIDKVLDRRGPWTDESFVGGKTVSCS